MTSGAVWKLEVENMQTEEEKREVVFLNEPNIELMMKMVEFMCLKDHGCKLLLKLLANPEFLNFLFFNLESGPVQDFLYKALDPTD